MKSPTRRTTAVALCTAALALAALVGCSAPQDAGEAPPPAEQTEQTPPGAADRRDAEEAITAFFHALDQGDCEALNEVVVDPSNPPLACSGGAEHDRLRILEITGIAQETPGEYERVSETVATDFFLVSLDVKPVSPSPWNEGENTRFVRLAKADDGQWRVQAVTSSP